MPFPGGLWWLLCCRQGFTLLRRDYCEASKGVASEDEVVEESFELRRQGDEDSTLQVNLTQPSRASSCSERSLPVTEETHSLITENCGRMQHEPDAIVKGWLQREVRGGIKTPWLRPRKYWFVLTEDSLDYYSGCEVSAPRLGSLVLTSLCSVLWPDKQTYKETAQGGQGYAGLRDEAVKLFHSLQQLEELRDPILLMQGVLQTCHDLPALVDEIFCQLVKQTTEPPIPGAPTDLRYWQLLVCMSYTFIPSVPILCYLHLHLQRMEKMFPRSPVTHYGHLITQALHKSKGRECVPSLDEIATLIGSQEIPNSTHCPDTTTTCYVAITSNATAQKHV
ncbi:pleckstrin homology domain-containing family H member 3 isoform X2 [Ahaetulla prasina]|uniref:pleckstrin homology domain-containing family H member 3 isoform X2 n=1 Tax=Ahaetulla prasina TaxID=499056 RepID=UPI002648273D|nr:pleckstrin homology domain-containing family H member 3 isoform X2 [Ahaetulla prasina]